MTMSETGSARREGRGEDEGRGADERLNLAIDLTVRQTLDVEPPPGLRERVLRQISDSNQQLASGFSRKLLWGAIPLGAVATVVLAVLLPGTGSEPTPQPLSTVATAHPVASIEPPEVSPPAGGVAPVPPRAITGEGTQLLAAGPAASRPTGPIASERIVAGAAFEPVPGGVDIEPLTTIEPIRIAAMTPAAIEHQEVVVSPLSPIAQLRIAPLSPPDGRD